MADRNLPVNLLEAAVETVLAASPSGEFTLESVLKEAKGGDSQTLRRRLEQLLEGDERFFSDGSGGYRSRAAFFRGYEFPVTPDEWEIDSGLLLPGHRFAPYFAPEVFPSETELRETGGKAVSLKEIHAPLQQVFHYHILLGSEHVFDFLVAESAANTGLRAPGAEKRQVTLNAFDLKDFYNRTRFRLGDALLCRVLDYDQGVAEFRYLPGGERRDRDLKAYVAAFETAIGKVIDRWENYLEIPEQLALACFAGRETLPGGPSAASLDEFLRRTVAIEIDCSGDFAVLARRAEPDDAYVPELPEGIAISRGETGEIGDLLREIGSPLTPAEVDSFILDNAWARELEFEDFFVRAFGRGKLRFTDEGQQAVFQNYIEDRFEELTGSYNREDDEQKAELRGDIVELASGRLEFFDYLASLESDPAELPKETLRRLAEVSMQLNDILKMLNDPGFTPDAAELERLAETVELRADDQETLIAELTEAVEKGRS